MSDMAFRLHDLLPEILSEVLSFLTPLSGALLALTHSNPDPKLTPLPTEKLLFLCAAAGHINLFERLQVELDYPLPIDLAPKLLGKALHNARVEFSKWFYNTDLFQYHVRAWVSEEDRIERDDVKFGGLLRDAGSSGDKSIALHFAGLCEALGMDKNTIYSWLIRGALWANRIAFACGLEKVATAHQVDLVKEIVVEGALACCHEEGPPTSPLCILFALFACILIVSSHDRPSIRAEDSERQYSPPAHGWAAPHSRLCESSKSNWN